MHTHSTRTNANLIGYQRGPTRVAVSTGFHWFALAVFFVDCWCAVLLSLQCDLETGLSCFVPTHHETRLILP
jgi:hypothetical protein